MPPAPASRLGPLIDVRDLFEEERGELLGVLETLDEPTWHAPTACPGWAVKDIAAHILGDDLGRLARTRDDFHGPGPGAGERFPEFIDRSNEEWVVAARRLSPALVVSGLRWSGAQVADLWRSLPLDETSEPVSWAGPEDAPVWLDAARDFSEYWTHQQQIREAAGAPLLLRPRYTGPVVDTLLRALPEALRTSERVAGTEFAFVVEGPGGGVWTVRRDAQGWRFVEPSADAPNHVTVDVDTAWRLCTRGIDPATARERAQLEGDEDLARAALTILSVIHSG